MKYAQMRQFDVANGVGIRSSLFVSGCHFHCENCFNEEYWRFDYGQEYDKAAMDRFISYGEDENVTGYSILGGEPMDQLEDDSLLLTLKKIKEQNGKSVWLWTGFTFETLSEKQRELLNYIDVLVDGQFVQEKKNLTLLFRGSENQRIIDVQRTLKQGKIIPWEKSNGY
ncbi:MAG: anaerobic ribonucleoside-triphosphate reductase activating protein [Oscillospiraceae bacterium]